MLAMLIALLCACGRDEEQPTARTGATRAGDTTTQSFMTQSQAVQILKAIDRARVIGAQAVSLKSENEVVLEYARVVRADHGAISAELDTALATARLRLADHPLNRQLQLAADQFAAEIATRDTGVNNSYLGREITDHERALQLLYAFVPHATGQIKVTLERVIPAYHAHLERAREILAARRAAAAALPPPTAAPTQPATVPDTTRRPPVVVPITTTTTTM